MPRMKDENRKRGMRIRFALRTVKEYDGEDDLRTTIVDALADIHHLCDLEGFHIDELINQAFEHYYCEKNTTNISHPTRLARRNAKAQPRPFRITRKDGRA